MILIIRYILLYLLILFIPYGYVNIRSIIWLQDSIKSTLVFERYDGSGRDGIDNSAEYIYAIGKVNGLESKVEIAYTSSLKSFYSDSLDNLKLGDSVKIWYNKKSNTSYIRDYRKDKEYEIKIRFNKICKESMFYFLLLIIFEYLYRKEKKNEKLKFKVYK